MFRLPHKSFPHLDSDMIDMKSIDQLFHFGTAGFFFARDYSPQKEPLADSRQHNLKDYQIGKI